VWLSTDVTVDVRVDGGEHQALKFVDPGYPQAGT
jgi:hypothetical protein